MRLVIYINGLTEGSRIATPAKTVVKLVEECGRAGIQGMIIISAGFNEMGAKGKTAFLVQSSFLVEVA